MRRFAFLFATTAIIAAGASPAFAFGPERFDASAIKIDNVAGRLAVTVDPSASGITVAVTGPEKFVSRVTVKKDGSTVVVDQDRQNYHRIDDDEWIDVKVTLPPGTALNIEDFIGEGTVGELNGPLAVEDMTSGSLNVGRVTSASIGVSGSGDIKLGDVDGNLSVGINGSGEVETGRAGGAVELEINGSGDVNVGGVNGPVSAEINGSGDIVIASGRARPLSVDISGSGNVLLDGIAEAQEISQSGSGKVKITGKAS